MSKRDDLKRLHAAAMEAQADWLTIVCQDAAMRTDQRAKKAELFEALSAAQRAFAMAANAVPNE